MLYDDITLIKQTISTDTIGNELATESSRVVFAEVDSISQSEFYAAANTDLNPDLKFVVFFDDYEGEALVEFQGVRYWIYRTYRAGDYMELYAERKTGGIPTAAQEGNNG